MRNVDKNMNLIFLSHRFRSLQRLKSTKKFKDKHINHWQPVRSDEKLNRRFFQAKGLQSHLKWFVFLVHQRESQRQNVPKVKVDGYDCNDVDVWNEEKIFSKWTLSAHIERRRTMLASWVCVWLGFKFFFKNQIPNIVASIIHISFPSVSCCCCFVSSPP